MPRITDEKRLLTANARTIAKAVRMEKAGEGSIAEFRVKGVRGLVLHVMPSGTATWYVHYDVQIGKTRKRRKRTRRHWIGH